MDQIGSADLQRSVESKIKTSSIEKLAQEVETTPETLKLIIDGLTQPPGFDIRQSKICATRNFITHLSNFVTRCTSRTSSFKFITENQMTVFLLS